MLALLISKRIRDKGIMRGKGGRVFRNDYKGHMDKTKAGGWKQGREVRMAGVGRE